MKKTTILGLLTLFLISLLATGAHAQQGLCPSPFPVWGIVDYFGERIANQEIEISALDRYGHVQKSWIAVTNDRGEYSDDLSNHLGDIRGCWLATDVVKVKGCDSFDSCEQSVNILDKSSVQINFVYSEGAPKVIVESNTVTEYKDKPVYVCSDGSQVVDASLCPKVIDEPPVEPVDDNQIQDWLIGLIAGIIGVFAWGAGFAGLIKYYLRLAKEADKAGNRELAKKHRERAEKMAKTVVLNFLAGKYKK